MGLPVTTYLDNTPTPSPDTDYGIIITQPGYNATTASSQNQIFNSSWPSLQVIYQGPTPENGYAHGLGFPPFAVTYSSQGFFESVTGPYMDFEIADVDSTYVYGLDYITVYNIDLTKDIDFPLLNQSTEATKYDPDYGIKVVKSGKSIDSTDMRDFILHSRCQAPTVLAVKTQATSNNLNLPEDQGSVIQYTNQLGYPSWNFGFVIENGVYVSAPLFTQDYPGTFTNGITTYVQYFGAGATIVVLRNPLFVTFLNVETY